MTTEIPRPEIPGLRLDSLLGEGGYGQVWRATRLSDHTRVAVKVMHLELVRSVDALTRFQREIEATQRLDHPNVIRAHDHGALDDGRPYLVLEYLEGKSLREVLLERGALRPREVLELLAPLCDALAVAHDAGLVHRDVKPSNVILARGLGGEVRPVLLDFGLVKLIDDAGPGLTSSRSMLGTPSAMSPEQMRGLTVDARSDVYALGLLAYHMLTGLPAYGGAPGVVHSYLQVYGKRPEPSARVEIDPAIDAPITRALAPEPAQRFQTTRDFYEALRTVILGSRDESVEPIEVLALYVERGEHTTEDVVASATVVATQARMMIALTAPDSIIAVARRERVNTDALRAELFRFSDIARIALGMSRATIRGNVVDGEALDVESWAPSPLPTGLWVADLI